MKAFNRLITACLLVWLTAASGSTVSANSHDSAPRVLTLFEMTDLYSSPDASSLPNGTITPQVVHVTGMEPGWLYKDDYWIRISTWMGDQWIHPNVAYPGEERPKIVTLRTTGEEELYHYPLTGHFSGAKITPQTIHVLSELGPWLKIQTWQGPKWIKPKNPVMDENPEDEA